MVYAGFSGLSRAGRGKSELQRAMCQVTPGRPGSNRVDGKCHRENTAAEAEPGERTAQAVALARFARAKQLAAEPLNDAVRVKRCGKSAPAGQQCAAHGKPHTEQDQIGK